MIEHPKRSDHQIQHDVLEELNWDTRVRAPEIGVEVVGAVVTLSGTVANWPARLAAVDAAHRVSGVQDIVDDIHVKLPGAYARDDAEISRSVRHALEWDILVPHERIKTTVGNGVVTLEGTVNFLSQHDDAGRCVRNLPGVREVDNRLRVVPERASAEPEAVRASIERALQRHAAHAVSHVRVEVADGKVTLLGSVPSLGELHAIAGAVRGTAGVARVDNQMRVNPNPG